MKFCVVTISALLVVGCAAPYRTPLESNSLQSEYVTRQMQTANKLAADGRLFQASLHWRSVLTLQPDNDIALKQLALLGRTIEKGVNAARRDAKKWRGQANHRRETVALQRILVLRPNDSKALAQLTQIASKRARTLQADKVVAENSSRSRSSSGVTDEEFAELLELEKQQRYAQLLPALADFPEGDKRPDFSALHVRVLRHVANRDKANGQFEKALVHLRAAISLTREEQVQQELAEVEKLLSVRWYRQGLKMLTRDPQLAADAFSKSVAYNPTNLVAAQQLEKAKRMAAKLVRLGTKSKN